MCVYVCVSILLLITSIINYILYICIICVSLNSYNWKSVCVCLGSGGRLYVCVHAQISHYRQNKLPAGTVILVCVCGLWQATQ